MKKKRFKGAALRLLWCADFSPKSDNGAEFIAESLREWLPKRGVRPCCPSHTPLIALKETETTKVSEPPLWALQGHLSRHSCLNRWWFISASEAREVVEAWLEGQRGAPARGF